MGTGLGPPWFSQEFPALASRRDPFPDVERWQTTYVRYSASEAAQAGKWDAENCRRNLQNTGVDHPGLRQNILPDYIHMRIIEAPAEFALPVKQDRRLLPCFKVRLEVQHRGVVSLPITLRAHVLSQQDKEQITSWLPPDDTSSRDDKGQKAATELKGTAFIRCTLEAGSAGEIRPVGLGGKDGQSLPPSANGGSTAFTLSPSMGGAERPIKTEPLYGTGGAANGGLGVGVVSLGPAAGSGCGSGLGAAGGYGVCDPSGPVVNGMMCDLAAAGLSCPGRDVNLNSLFAANRPDPVVTLASSVRMSTTGSSLTGLGGAAAAAASGTSGGLRLNPGDTRDSFGAAVEMLMQPSGQQQQQQHPSWPIQAMVEPGVCGLQRQRQQHRQEQQQQGSARGRPERSGSSFAGAGGNGGGAVMQCAKLISATQDFEFTNLEFLKPTRMNKVYMAFTASILDTDLLYVVFNIPTIGICRAEQREKACKKLQIDYRLLSHFDQSGAQDRMDTTVTAAAAPSAGLPPGGGDGGMVESVLELNLPPSGARFTGAAAAGRLPQGNGPVQQQQPHQQQLGLQQQQQVGAQEHRFAPSLNPNTSLLSSGGGGPDGGAGVPAKYGGRQDSGRLQAQLSETDYPRMPSGLDVQQQHSQQQLPPHPNQQQLQQQLQRQLQLQQRLAEGCSLVMGGGGTGGSPALHRAGGMGGAGGRSGVVTLGGGLGPDVLLGGVGSGLPPHALANGGLAPGSGVLGLNGMGACGGVLVSRMMQGCGLTSPFGGGMAADLGSAGPDLFFGGACSGGGAAAGMNGGLGCGGGLGGGSSFGGLMDNGLSGSLQNGMGNGGGGGGMGLPGGLSMGGGGGGAVNGHAGMELAVVLGNSRKREQGLNDDDNYRFQPVQPAPQELPPYPGFVGLTSSDVDMLLPAPHSRMAMRDFINEVYDSTGLHRKLTHMDVQALLSQAGFPMDSNREHDTISPQQWEEFCSQYRSIVNTLQQVASVWNLEDPVVISGFDMDRAGTITALVNEPAGTFICRFSMSQPGCLVLTCKVGTVHPRADPVGLIHAIIKIDDLHERRVDTWIRDYAGATHLLDVYRQKRVDKRKVFATNYTRLRGLEMGGEQPPSQP